MSLKCIHIHYLKFHSQPALDMNLIFHFIEEAEFASLLISHPSGY